MSVKYFDGANSVDIAGGITTAQVQDLIDTSLEVTTGTKTISATTNGYSFSGTASWSRQGNVIDVCGTCNGTLGSNGAATKFISGLPAPAHIEGYTCAEINGVCRYYIELDTNGDIRVTQYGGTSGATGIWITIHFTYIAA